MSGWARVATDGQGTCLPGVLVGQRIANRSAASHDRYRPNKALDGRSLAWSAPRTAADGGSLPCVLDFAQPATRRSILGGDVGSRLVPANARGVSAKRGVPLPRHPHRRVFRGRPSGHFPQSRYGFLLGLALWGAICGFTASLLSNFAAYAASLAGYTAAIIAGDASSSLNQIFVLAVSRASEIAIGIGCATVVVAGTDFGRARAKLMQDMSAIVAVLSKQLINLLEMAGTGDVDPLPLRRDVIKRITALGPTIDLALGEVSDFRERQATLLGAVNSLFAVTSEWRTLADHLDRVRPEQAQSQARVLLDSIPPGLRAALSSGEAHVWSIDPVTRRECCVDLARTLLSVPASEPSLRLTADRFAAAAVGLAQAANGLALLAGPNLAQARRRAPPVLGAQDLLPPLVNAIRIFVAIASVELFWVVTEWPGGQSAVTFAFIATILMSPQNEGAVAAASAFAWAMVLTTVLAAIAKFALMPTQQSFAGLTVILALFLVPLGALSTIPRLAPYLVLAVVNFSPLMSITNVTSYNVLTFYNNALPILLGVCAAASALYIIPPVPPKVRAANLLFTTLVELRLQLTALRPANPASWDARVYQRLAAMPDEAEPAERERLVAALTVGREAFQLRRLVAGTPMSRELQGCFRDVAEGQLPSALSGLSAIDRWLAKAPLPSGAAATMRARAALQAFAEALDAHPVYFGRLGAVR